VFTLVFTCTIAVYLLGPDLVSRFFLGFVCQRRAIVQTKSEELTRAIAWAVIPLAIAYLWAEHLGPLNYYLRPHDWSTFFSGLANDNYFENNRGQFIAAAADIWDWNVCLLWRLYLIVALFWIGFDVIIIFYGRIRENAPRFLKKVLAYFILPRVSEWYIYLSGMLTRARDLEVHADVLTRKDGLYSGRVVDKSLAADGSLAFITLASPRRFRRAEYLDAKHLENRAEPVKPEDFWVKVDGESFIIMASDISTLNVRHSSVENIVRDKVITDKLRALVEEYQRKIVETIKPQG
jgi:hypothetical protein